MKSWWLILLGILGLLWSWFYMCPRLCAAPAATAVVVPAPVTAPAVIAPAPAPLPTASVGAQWVNGKVELTGEVPDAATKQKYVDAANTTYGAGNIVDKLKLNDKLSVLNWFGSQGAMAPFGLKDWKFGKAAFDGKTLTLTGEAINQTAKDAAGNAAKAAVGADVTVDNQIVVAAAKVQKRRLDEALAGKTIEFNSGSARLTAAGRKVLDDLTPIFKDDGSTKVRVEGHTDNVGGAEPNLALSQSRAEATVAYLVGKGLEAARFAPTGLGETKPIADNASAEGRHKNRRIEFHVMEGK